VRSTRDDDHKGDGISVPPPPETEPGKLAAASPGGGEPEPDWADETRGITWLLASGSLLGLVAWCSAVGLLPDLLHPGWIAPAAVVAMAVVGVLRLRRVCATANRRGGRAAKAFLEAADGVPPPTLPAGDPLGDLISKAASRFEARLEDRLAEEKASHEARTRRDILRLRAEFETLVERHARKSLAEKREADAQLAALSAQSDEEKVHREEERREGERRLREAEAASASLRERLQKLERTLAASADDNSRLAERAEILAREAETLRRQGVRFFDRLAPQLRGPLRIVDKLAAELGAQAQEVGAGALQEGIGQIRTRVGQTERLVDEIIELCKMEAASVSLVYSELDPAKLVRASVEDVQDRARGKSLQLSTRLPRDLPAIRTDLRLTGKILRELILNAIQFTPRGGRIVVSVEVRESLPSPDGRDRDDGRALCLSVADTGSGIAAEDQERIFQPFERGGEPRFTLTDSTAGLGLTLARGYARLLGGDLQVESAAGRGSVFRLLLPAKDLVPAGVRY
jgi:signal transduction histidine kinase